MYRAGRSAELCRREFRAAERTDPARGAKEHRAAWLMPATPAWPPKSAPRLFVSVPLADGARLVLDGPQAHYLATVMRVGEGDAVILCDDSTGEWAARVAAVSRREVTLTIETRLRAREQVPDFMLCAALLKKPHFDLVMEKAAELGVRRVEPVITRRCVADKLN